MAKKKKAKTRKAEEKTKQRTRGGYLNEWRIPHKFANNPLDPTYEKLYLLGADLPYIHRHVELAQFLRDLRSGKNRIKSNGDETKRRKESTDELLSREIKTVLKAIGVLLRSPLVKKYHQLTTSILPPVIDLFTELTGLIDFIDRLLAADKELHKVGKPQGDTMHFKALKVLFDTLGLSRRKGKGERKLITWLLGKIIEHLRLTTQDHKPHTGLARGVIEIVFQKKISAKAAHEREQTFKAMPRIEVVPV